MALIENNYLLFDSPLHNPDYEYFFVDSLVHIAEYDYFLDSYLDIP